MARTSRRAKRAALELVPVEKWKRPYGVVSQWDAYVLSEDRHGLWLHSPRDSVHHLKGGEKWIVPWNGVQLLPCGSPWWVAWFWDRPAAKWTSADVCTPPVLDNGRWSYIDLELDAVGDERGFDHIADEDEFLEAVAAGHISLTEARRARSAVGEIQDRMVALGEPFGTVGWLTLDFAVELKLPPTT